MDNNVSVLTRIILNDDKLKELYKEDPNKAIELANQKMEELKDQERANKAQIDRIVANYAAKNFPNGVPTPEHELIHQYGYEHEMDPNDEGLKRVYESIDKAFEDAQNNSDERFVKNIFKDSEPGQEEHKGPAL